MRKFFPLILLLLSINSFAQFKTIHADGTPFFKCQKQLWWEWEGARSIFIPIKIEAVSIVNEDTLYNNFRVFGEGSGECLMNKDYAWTGKKIIMTKDHQEIFINSDGDSLIFKKYKNTNDSWTFFQTEQNHFVATVISKGLETFNLYEDQVTDSVLTIAISLKKNEDNSPLSHPFNGKEWKISKKYGFIKTYNLLDFPQDTNALVLAGENKFNIGVKNLTEKEIYDFEVGDEFHIREYDYGHSNGGKKIVQKVLDKSLNEGADSVIYKISIVENIAKNSWDPSAPVIAILDTIIYMKVALYPTLKEINEIPTKPYIWNNPYSEYSSNYQFLRESPSVMAKFNIEYSGYYTTDDSCFQGVLSSNFDYFIKPYEYWKGLGGPYYDKRIGEIMYPKGRELVYYKKSYGEWGTPMELVMGTYPNKISASVSLSPNPTTDRIKISSEEIQNTTYKVYNIDGREMLNGIFAGTEENVDVSSLKTGLYSLIIMKEGGVIYTSRFVKN